MPARLPFLAEPSLVGGEPPPGVPKVKAGSPPAVVAPAASTSSEGARAGSLPLSALPVRLITLSDKLCGIMLLWLGLVEFLKLRRQARERPKLYYI